MNKALYPLKFKTIFKDKIWGGNKIKTILNKDFAPLDNCGETWELSGVEGNVSTVSEGKLINLPLDQLCDIYKSDLLGTKNYERFGNEFPLLIKFIDANQDLSIQVHPNDELAKSRHNGNGKTEMWYIIQADEDAQLISGFNKPITKEEYIQHFEGGTLSDILNKESVCKGDLFFIPSGRVHTIGKGCFLAEIQQTSDYTYRIYDFDRVDIHGNKRELHIEQALDAIDYTFHADYKTKIDVNTNEVTPLVDCKYFKTEKLNINGNKAISIEEIDSFMIILCCEGNLEIETDIGNVSLIKGEVTLLPAITKDIRFEAKNAELLLVTIPS